MIISFTGTRSGMTEAQKTGFLALLTTYKPDIFVHGDCTGADADGHQIALKYGVINIYKRPGNIEQYRAHTKEGTCVSEPKPPLERNKDIVDSGDILIACPGKNHEELRSGTWATIRYARQMNKTIVILWPDGRLQHEDKKERFK